MTNRVTQANTSVLAAPTSQRVRVTQANASALALPTSQRVRVTQANAIALALPTSSRVRVTQANAAVLNVFRSANLRVTQVNVAILNVLPIGDVLFTQEGVTFAGSMPTKALFTQEGVTFGGTMPTNAKFTQEGVTIAGPMPNKTRVTQVGFTFACTAPIHPVPELGDGSRVVLFGKRLAATPVWPTIIEEVLVIDGTGIGTVTLNVNDPQYRISFVEWQTRKGNAGTLSAWLKDEVPQFQGSVGTLPGELSRIQYRVTTIADDGSESITLGGKIYFDSTGRQADPGEPDGPPSTGEFSWGTFSSIEDVAQDTFTVTWALPDTNIVRPTIFFIDWQYPTADPDAIFGPSYIFGGFPQLDAPTVTIQRTGFFGHGYDLVDFIFGVGTVYVMTFRIRGYDAAYNLISTSPWMSVAFKATGPHTTFIL